MRHEASTRHEVAERRNAPRDGVGHFPGGRAPAVAALALAISAAACTSQRAARETVPVAGRMPAPVATSAPAPDATLDHAAPALAPSASRGFLPVGSGLARGLAASLAGAGQATTMLDGSDIVEDAAPSTRVPGKTPRWWLILGEASLLFGVQELFYWTLMKPENVVDFDYGLDWPSFRARFITLDAWRYDNNLYDTNALRHPAQGMANYLFARTNYLSVPSSYLFSFGLSSVWEIAGEYREIISINDMVMTPATAMPIAEAFAQMGAFFGLYEWLDSARPRWMRNLGAVWLEGPIWHDFRLSLGGGLRENHGTVGPTSSLSIDTEIIRIAGYGRPGATSQLLMNGNYSQLTLRAGFDDGGLNDFLFFARAALIARYDKAISAETAHGYDLIFGISSAFEYGMHWLGPEHEGSGTRDQMAIAHLAGPTLDARLLHGDFEVRAILDLFGNFAMVRNYALWKLQAAVGDANMKSSVLREKYHYALGVSAVGRLLARYRRIEGGVRIQQDVFDSLEGRDRYQEEIEYEYDLEDTRRIAEVWLSYALPLGRDDTRTRIGVTMSERHRQGWAGPYSDASHERAYMGRVVMVY